MIEFLLLGIGGFVYYEYLMHKSDKQNNDNDEDDIIHLDEHGRIVGVKNIVRAKYLMTWKDHVKHRMLCYYINIDTEEIWAEYYDSHTTYLDKNIIKFNLSDYKFYWESETEEQLNMIRDMIVKKYRMYPDTAKETSSKEEDEKYMTKYFNSVN